MGSGNKWVGLERKWWQRVGAGGMVGEQALTEGKEPGAPAISQEPERADADKAAREDVHERKALMADLSDAFVALPGGFGTLEEFCEVVTWTQLGLHAKPCGILNVLGYYTPLLAMFDHERFLKPENRSLVLAREKPADLLQALEG